MDINKSKKVDVIPIRIKRHYPKYKKKIHLNKLSD